MPDSEEWIVIGKVTGAHGVRGEIKLALFVDDVQFLHDIDALWLEKRDRRKVTLKRVRFHKKQVLLLVEEISDRTAAEQLRGYEVVIPFPTLKE